MNNQYEIIYSQVSPSGKNIAKWRSGYIIIGKDVLRLALACAKNISVMIDFPWQHMSGFDYFAFSYPIKIEIVHIKDKTKRVFFLKKTNSSDSAFFKVHGQDFTVTDSETGKPITIAIDQFDDFHPKTFLKLEIFDPNRKRWRNEIPTPIGGAVGYKIKR
jgi:hypothetical protein